MDQNYLPPNQTTEDEKVKILRLICAVTLIAILSPIFTSSAKEPKTATEAGLMQGFPPPDDKIVDISNWLAPPFNRWGFQHVNRVLHTTTVDRGDVPVWILDRRSLDLDAVTYKDKKGETHTFREVLAASYTDALVILHRGDIVFEKYFNGQTPNTRHIMFSATKSLAGTVTAILAHDGLLNPEKLVAHYIPELKSSAFGDASVRTIMDMTTGIKYSEKYGDMNSEVVAHMVATNYRPVPVGYTREKALYPFLASLKKKGKHDHSFHYVSANTEVLGWLINRATGKAVSEVFSERIWSILGVEKDGYVINGRDGTESWGGGFNGTARDMARFGQMILQGGMAKGQQVVPSIVVEGFRNGGDKSAFAHSSEGQPGAVMEGWSYRDQWWVTHNKNRAFTALGIYGQWIYVDPAAEMVIVKQSSYPSARGEIIDDDVTLALQAMGTYLRSLP